MNTYYSTLLYFGHEANNRERGKTVHVVFNIYPEALMYKGEGAGEVIPYLPLTTTLFSYRSAWIFHFKTT